MKTQFKAGDKVRRKKEYRDVNGWREGDDILTVQSQSVTGIAFKNVSHEWEENYFELVPHTLEEQVVRAFSLIGRNDLVVEGDEGETYPLGFVPEQVVIVPKTDKPCSSIVVNKFINKMEEPYAVVLGGKAYLYPAAMVKIFPHKTLNFNGTKVVVDKEKVKIDNIVISIKDMKEIMKVYSELSDNQ